MRRSSPPASGRMRCERGSPHSVPSTRAASGSTTATRSSWRSTWRGPSRASPPRIDEQQTRRRCWTRSMRGRRPCGATRPSNASCSQRRRAPCGAIGCPAGTTTGGGGRSAAAVRASTTPRRLSWAAGSTSSTAGRSRSTQSSRPAGPRPRICLIGPWDHSPLPLSSASGDSEFGWRAIVDLPALTLSWLDHALRGGPAPLLRTARTFATGADTWLDWDVWPPAAESLALWAAPGGRLVAGPPPAPGADRFIADADDPAPAMGGRLYSRPRHLRPGTDGPARALGTPGRRRLCRGYRRRRHAARRPGSRGGLDDLFTSRTRGCRRHARRRRTRRPCSAMLRRASRVRRCARTSPSAPTSTSGTWRTLCAGVIVCASTSPRRPSRDSIGRPRRAARSARSCTAGVTARGCSCRSSRRDSARPPISSAAAAYAPAR